MTSCQKWRVNEIMNPEEKVEQGVQSVVILISPLNTGEYILALGGGVDSQVLRWGECNLGPGQSLPLTGWMMSTASWTWEALTELAVRCWGGTWGSLIALLALDLIDLHFLMASCYISSVSTPQLTQMACRSSLPAFKYFLSVNSFSSD